MLLILEGILDALFALASKSKQYEDADSEDRFYAFAIILTISAGSLAYYFTR
jgi:hypothetical protein